MENLLNLVATEAFEGNNGDTCMVELARRRAVGAFVPVGAR